MQQGLQQPQSEAPSEPEDMQWLPLEAYEEDLRFHADQGAGGHDHEDASAQIEAELVAQTGGQDAQDLLDRQAHDALQAQQEADQEAQRKKARDDLFARLNQEQREAVFSPAHSALVLAAAGSGKTSVLTARIARLITAGPANAVRALSPSSILAVTFTNKAAQEMRTRLNQLLDRQTVHKIWVGTFHSLCARLLRDHAKEAGLPKTFAILDVDAQEALCRGILKDMGLTKSAAKQAKRDKQASAQQALDLGATPQPPADAAPQKAQGRAGASQATSENLNQRLMEAGAVLDTDSGDEQEECDLVSAAQCARYIGSRKEGGHRPHPPRQPVSRRSTEVDQLEAVYEEYQARCNRSGLVDFADLLERAVKLLQDNRTVRDNLQQRFSAILVDEFQDTNDLQYQWINLIKGPQAHIMAVGDDDQSIYAFRGAKPENMQRFLRDFTASTKMPEGRLIRLEHNYRSLPHILEAANAIISRNENRLGKTLRTTRPGAGELIDLDVHANGPDEARHVAQAIHTLVREQGAQPSEIAVLYRANQQSRLLEAELNKRGLPLTVYGGFRFYERQEVKYALAYLDLVADLTHDLSLAKVANFPPRGLGETTIEELRQDAQIRRVCMMEMITTRQQWRMESPAQIGNAAAQRRQVELEKLADIIMRLSEGALELDLHELVQRTLTDSGLLGHYTKLAEDEGEEGAQRLDNLKEIVSAARQFVIDNPQHQEQDTLGQLGEYLAHVALMSSTSESDMNAKNTISLMTVHSAKGLEFDHVFVTGLEEGTFPHSRATDEDAERAALQGREDDGNGDSAQEERRLMYVAVTRARKALKLSYCDQRMINGNVLYLAPSRFVEEVPEHLVQRHLEPRAEEGTWARTRQDWRPHSGAQGSAQGGAQGVVAPTSRRAPEVQTPSLAPRQSASTSSASSSAAKPSIFAALAARQVTQQVAKKGAELRGSTADATAEAATAAATGQRRVAVIGTAGRDKEHAHLLSADLWDAMLEHARGQVRIDDHLISGGAAWADHLAVELFLEGRVAGLTLHLPAPLSDRGRFVGEFGSSGGVANYYHERFRQCTGIDGLARIRQALGRGAHHTTQTAAPGYEAMKARNKLVASQCNTLLAYTWSQDGGPADGGTAQTWQMASSARREHVGLNELLAESQTQVSVQCEPARCRAA
jgi:DNA helicase-2/ATP-dependent DNA helicase PcrA